MWVFSLGLMLCDRTDKVKFINETFWILSSRTDVCIHEPVLEPKLIVSLLINTFLMNVCHY